MQPVTESAVQAGSATVSRRVLDSGRAVIVFDAAHVPQADEQIFDPAWWGGAAAPVAGSGRGSAWFITSPAMEAVLRHYRRGGLAARVSTDRYLWTGEARVRSIAEFHLLWQLRAKGLRVPRPLAARYRCHGLAYSADLLVQTIPGVRSLASLMAGGIDADHWRAAGAAIAALHRNGVSHADLNAHNILIDADGEAWLIDFDRGDARPSAGFAQRNLSRLRRSVCKVAGHPGELPDGFRHLLARYEQDMEMVR